MLQMYFTLEIASVSRATPEGAQAPKPPETGWEQLEITPAPRGRAGVAPKPRQLPVQDKPGEAGTKFVSRAGCS